MTARRLINAFALVCVLASPAVLSGCGPAAYAVTGAAIANSANQDPVRSTQPADWPCRVLSICE